jgi:modulator of FtsH protease HflK
MSDKWDKDPNKPPDLVDFIKKIFGKSDSQSPKKSNKIRFDPKWFALIPVLLVAIWGFTGFHVIKPQYKGVVTRFGEYQRTLEPGLAWVPPLVDEIDSVNVTKNRIIQVSKQPLTIDRVVMIDKQEDKTAKKDDKTTKKGDKTIEKEGKLIAVTEGDDDISTNIGSVKVAITVNYNIDNPRYYLFNVSDPTSILSNATQSALRQVVSSMNVDNVVSKKRGILQTKIKDAVSAMMEKYKSGIHIRSVTVQETTVPEEVKDAYHAVANAMSDKKKFISEGKIYKANRDQIQKGISSCLINRANAYSAREINKAKGDISRFNALLNAYESAEEVTKERMYHDAMGNTLNHTTNVLMNKSSGNMFYLPLDRLMNRPSADQGSSAAAESNAKQSSQETGKINPVENSTEGSDLAFCENRIISEYQKLEDKQLQEMSQDNTPAKEGVIKYATS